MIWDELGCNIAFSELRDPTSLQFLGLECEIEAVEDHGTADRLGWNVTTDGSLRNNGFEYISRPVTVSAASDMFRRLHGTIKLRDSDPFSQRTSIHVHANCANMEIKQVRTAILLYALFEEAFFLMCSQERRDNIHCTPLTETYLPSIYNSSLNNMIARWHKYTALNIKPLTKQGTIEFRHMQGHNDVKLLDEWLTIIQNLLTVAKEVSINQDLFEEEKIRTLFNQIFGKSRLGSNYELVRGMMANQILDIKLAVV